MTLPVHLQAIAPQTEPLRTVAVWIPDWPVIAALQVADKSPHLPAVVMSGQQRVFAANAAARSLGIRRGMRKRTAQGHCPEVLLLAQDDIRDAAEFEPVVAAVEQVASGVEVMRPGLVVLPGVGAARYYGGEPELLSALVESVSLAGFECQVGIADGILAAVLGAREQMLVPAGESASFLSGQPISELLTVAVGSQTTNVLTEAISLWLRLGLNTLGDLVALPSQAVAGRFGLLGVWAQQLARGLDLRPPAQERIATEISVSCQFDPPIYQLEPAVAVGHKLALQFVAAMTERSAACGRIRISATTATGELSRVWRTDDGAIGGLAAASLAQRLRWQLDAWLSAAARTRPSPSDVPDQDLENQPAPILALEIAAEEVAPASTYQMTLWGGGQGGDARAARALANVQGILGLDQVQAVALQGERTPWQREIKLPFGDGSISVPSANVAGKPHSALAGDSFPNLPDQRLAVHQETGFAPWPTALPDPSPSVLFLEPQTSDLLDGFGNVVQANLRTGQLLATPTELVFNGTTHGIKDWAGPWLIPGNWWESQPIAAVFLQVVTVGGDAYLLQLSAAGWVVLGSYH